MAWDPRAALEQLGVTQVAAAVWDQVLEAENNWSLEVDIGDAIVDWDALEGFRAGLRKAKAEELWPVLQEVHGELTGLRGLICVLASSASPEALACYMELVTVQGADGNGALRPAIFRHCIQALKTLRAGDEEDVGNLPILQAVARWAAAVNLMEDAFTQTLDAVATIVIAPASKQVLDVTLEVATALVSPRHGEIRKVFLTVCKALLPGGVMVGEGMRCAQGSTVTRVMHTRRKAVIACITGRLAALPDLLVEKPLPENFFEENKEEVPGAAQALADPVVTLLQQWVYWTPDRNDWRQASAESVCALLGACPDVVQRFAHVLVSFLGAEKPGQRLLAVDVCLALAEAFPGQVPVQARILDRCKDPAPTVRAKAFSGLSVLVQGDCKDDSLKEMLTNKESEKYVDVAALFNVHVADPKPMVRKAAVTVFDAMIPFLIEKVGLTRQEAVDFFDIRECAQRTQDESVMVRKAACGALCKLLQLCPESDAVLQMWSLFVLPLVQDSEQSVSEKGLDEVERFVFQPLADWGQQEQVELGEDGIFKLLAAIGANSDALEFLLRSWRFSIKRAEAGTRPGVTGFLDAIRRAVDLVHVSSESPSSAIHCGMALWSLAEEAASVDAENIPARSALDAWRRCQDCSQDKRLVLFAVRILRIVQMKAAVLEDEVKGELAAGWLEKIPACETPALVSEMVRALEAAKPGAVAALVPDCVERITKFAIGGEAVDRIQEALFAMGEIVLQTSIGKVSDQCVTSVQTIATNTVMFEGSAVKLPEDVRGYAVITWGKMCLKDDQLAKKSVEPLVLHLKDGECFSVRNNILLVLADLCVMYTSLVDRFVPMMTNCLNSEYELLRKHAAMVLSHLLSEDFIKFRGSIQHRFIYALSDPADYVREFVEAVFERVLLHRITQPATCFVDAITALNGWLGCKLYQGARGNASFLLADEPVRRQRVYVFLLDRMTNEMKFAVQAGIVSNVLSLFADENDDGSMDAVDLPQTYDEPAGKVLRDCLKLLACKEIRVSFAKKEAGDDDEAPAAAAAAAGDQAKEKAISGLLKKHMAETVVPTLVSLKFIMEKKRSIFLRDLRACLNEVIKDYRDELSSLNLNTQLLREIAWDLKLELGGGEGEKAAAPNADTRKALDLSQEPTTPRRALGDAPDSWGSAGPNFSAGPSGRRHTNRSNSFSAERKGSSIRVPKARSSESVDGDADEAPDAPPTAVKAPSAIKASAVKAPAPEAGPAGEEPAGEEPAGEGEEPAGEEMVGEEAAAAEEAALPATAPDAAGEALMEPPAAEAEAAAAPAGEAAAEAAVEPAVEAAAPTPRSARGGRTPAAAKQTPAAAKQTPAAAKQTPAVEPVMEVEEVEEAPAAAKEEPASQEALAPSENVIRKGAPRTKKRKPEDQSDMEGEKVEEAVAKKRKPAKTNKENAETA